MKVAYEIAKTHLLAKKKQTFIAMLGVTFGIAMFIAMTGLMTGLNDMTEDLAMTSTPDIRIYHEIAVDRASILDETQPEAINIIHHQKPKDENSNLRNAFQIINVLKADERTIGASPQLSTQVFYNFGPVQLNGSILGTDILEENKLFNVQEKMVEGQIENLALSRDGILMGKGLAKKLHAKVGDRVTISTPEGFTMKLKIVGLFQMGIGQIDNVRSYANLSTVQKIMQKDSRYITDINIKLKDFQQAKAIAPSYQKMFGYKAEDWETANTTTLLGVVIRNIMTWSVSITLLAVAGFGIYNILNMTIYSKMKDIAILKATGFAGKDVMQIFMIQAVVIGFLGSIIGLGIGYFLSYLIAQAPFDGGDVISITHLPVNFSPTFYTIGIVFGIITTALAGYFPARKAAKLDPIEIIRGQ